ncbi:MAG: hypothetical protein ACJAXS_001226 [Colwellia sp.]|jgi:hypothetical protein
MTINTNYELSASDNVSFDDDQPSNEFDNDIAEFERHANTNDVKKSKSSKKLNFIARRKIEQLHEDRQLRKLDLNYYDEWS